MDIGTCRLIWRLLVSNGDRDGDGVNEKVPPDTGTNLIIEFTPQAPTQMPVPGANPPYTLTPQSIFGTFDANGQMVTMAPDADGILLPTDLAWVHVDELDSPLLVDPIPDNRATYSVSVRNMQVNGRPFKIDEFGIHPTAGQITDLTELVTVQAGGGVELRRGASVVDRRLEGANIIFIRDDGSELPPVPIPAVEQLGAVRLDTDGVPYFVPEFFGLGSSLALDVDGIPYTTIGA